MHQCRDGPDPGWEVYSGSAAAGPALEGQQIEMGMLAAPGTISDVNIMDGGWDNWVLDEEYLPLHCDTMNPVRRHS